MVLKAIGCTPSARNPLFYNINKIEQGEAELVAVRNIRSAEFGVLYRTLMEREALAIRTEKPSVHLALSGDDGETLTDEQAVELLDRCLKPLDMDDQPYFIVRHDDTDHVHYHVVSTKIKEDGRSILWNGIGKRLIRELMRYQEKYGYKAGKDLHAAKLHEANVEKKGTKADILRVFDTHLAETTFHSREEFIADMKAKSVRMAVFISKHTGREMLRCSKLDEKAKKAITRPVYFEEEEVSRLDKAVERNNRPVEQKKPEVVMRPNVEDRKRDAMSDKRAFVRGLFTGAEIDWPGISLTLEGRDVMTFYVNDKRYAVMSVEGTNVVSLDPIPFGPVPPLRDIMWMDQSKELLAYTGRALVPLRPLIPQGLFVPERNYDKVTLPPGFRIEECEGSLFLIMPNGQEMCFDDDRNRRGLYIRLKKGGYDVITSHQRDNQEKIKKITGQTPPKGRLKKKRSH